MYCKKHKDARGNRCPSCRISELEEKVKMIESQLAALNTRTLGSAVIGGEPPTPYWTDEKMAEFQSSLLVDLEKRSKSQ